MSVDLNMPWRQIPKAKMSVDLSMPWRQIAKLANILCCRMERYL